MQPADTPDVKESPVQVTVLAGQGEDEPLGSGLLVAHLVVLADETLSRALYDRADLFPGERDDVAVLFPCPGDVEPQAPLESGAAVPPDPTDPAQRDPGAPVFVVELVDGERTERIEVCEVYRSLDKPRPWVGFGLATASALPIGEVPAEAKEGLFDPLERNNWVCLLMPRACRR